METDVQNEPAETRDQEAPSACQASCRGCAACRVTHWEDTRAGGLENVILLAHGLRRLRDLLNAFDLEGAERREHGAHWRRGETLQEMRALSRERVAGEVAHAAFRQALPGIRAKLESLGLVPCEDRQYQSGMYLIGESRGSVKVGISAKPRTRLTSLRHETGRKNLRFLALFPSLARHLEQASLNRFEDQRLGGEWLRRTPEVQAFIDACALVAPPPETA